MPVPRDLLLLNLAFADRVLHVTDRPLHEVLFRYTMLFRSFNISRRFDPDNAVWKDYIDCVSRSDTIRDTTLAFYAHRMLIAEPPVAMYSYGCFGYALSTPQTARIHFFPREPHPLSSHCEAHRREELCHVIRHMKKESPDTVSIVGRSWLYNLPAYRRLFPSVYLASAEPCAPMIAYPRLALWGQFLKGTSDVRHDMVDVFAKRLTNVEDENGLYDCFPCKVLRLEASVDAFLDHLSI